MYKLVYAFLTLTVALSSFSSANDKSRFTISRDAQQRLGYICTGAFQKDSKLAADKKAALSSIKGELIKRFCTASTFHCTDSQSLFGKNSGVCDAKDLCQRPELQIACQVACIDNRRKDIKTSRITKKLSQCGGVSNTQNPVNESKTPDVAPTQNPQQAANNTGKRPFTNLFASKKNSQTQPKRQRSAPTSPPIMFDEKPGLQSQNTGTELQPADLAPTQAKPEDTKVMSEKPVPVQDITAPAPEAIPMDVEEPAIPQEETQAVDNLPTLTEAPTPPPPPLLPRPSAPQQNSERANLMEQLRQKPQLNNVETNERNYGETTGNITANPPPKILSDALIKRRAEMNLNEEEEEENTNGNRPNDTTQLDRRSPTAVTSQEGQTSSAPQRIGPNPLTRPAPDSTINQDIDTSDLMEQLRQRPNLRKVDPSEQRLLDAPNLGQVDNSKNTSSLAKSPLFQNPTLEDRVNDNQANPDYFPNNDDEW